MASFSRRYILYSAMVFLAAATVSSAIRKPQTHRVIPEDEPIESVAYESIEGPMGLRCSLAASLQGCGRFQAFFMGSEAARVSYGQEGYFFWLASYDQKHFYFCSVGDLEQVGLSPIFRPSFAVFASGLRRHQEDVAVKFPEGEYDVEIMFKEGRATSQSYYLSGHEAFSAKITRFQKVDGHTLPETISLDSHDGRQPIVLHMGTPEINSGKAMNLPPPQGKTGKRLERIF